MKTRITYAVCEYCGKAIVPSIDSECIELAADAYAHEDCVQQKIKHSNLPEDLKEIAEDEIIFGTYKIPTPEWEDDGSDMAYESQF